MRGLKAPLVAVTPYGRDVDGVGGIVLNFNSEAADIHIHYFELTEEIAAPDCI